MSNSVSGNPIYIDTQGSANILTSAITISAIVVNASADNWDCILQDGSGNTIFERLMNVAGNRGEVFTPCVPFPANGVAPTTLTNIKNVLVYLGG
jgi:hypothetical protein